MKTKYVIIRFSDMNPLCLSYNAIKEDLSNEYIFLCRSVIESKRTVSAYAVDDNDSFSVSC